jgi:hypothetical protein
MTRVQTPAALKFGMMFNLQKSGQIPALTQQPPSVYCVSLFLVTPLAFQNVKSLKLNTQAHTHTKRQQCFGNVSFSITFFFAITVPTVLCSDATDGQKIWDL